jgi:carboxypeptidase C (cathepsin A)
MATESTSAAPASVGNRPFDDPVAYGCGPDDSVADVTEGAAVTHHTTTLDGGAIAYTATAGHLVTVGPSDSRPTAKVFYVAFTKDWAAETTRPVTFLYNGGPGAAMVFLLLGSFAPRRIVTSMPEFTPPAPYRLEDNPDSLLDRSDLVFVDPVGAGYSTAVAPHTNKEFWGTDPDADLMMAFIQRYLTKYERWNSPKFLFGESYGTPRTCILAYRLHLAGIDLNGITLQSSILDYGTNNDAVGGLPTGVAVAAYHHRLRRVPAPTDLATLAADAEKFASGPYAAALAAFPKCDPATIDALAEYTGIDKTTLLSWQLNPSPAGWAFRSALLRDRGLVVGGYDGRVTGDAAAGDGDPSDTAVAGVYTVMWHTYLAEELGFTTNSAFVGINGQVFDHWDFSHTGPSNAAAPGGALYTAGDLAAVMQGNPDLRVLSANGYYDYVTPFYRTVLDLAAMPLADAAVRGNITTRFYPSGHMIYLDADSRTAFKRDLAQMYDRATGGSSAGG